MSELSERILRGFSFRPGHRYADWRAGDPVSDRGLTTLIVGSSGRIPEAARIVVAFGAAALVGFLIWLVWSMRKESQQRS